MEAAKTNTSALSRLLAAFEARNTSEKRLLFWSIPGLILFVGTILFVEPIFIEMGDIEKRKMRVEKQIASFTDTKRELIDAALVDPNKQIKVDIKQAKARLAVLEKSFDTELGQLVSPQAMSVLLAQLFEKTGSLKLQKMESIKPIPLFTEEGSDKHLFQHGIRMTIEGGYLDTRDFLAQAEALGWKLYWRYLEYQVDEHPKATTELEVFTLSTSEAFIGVY
ncbi:MAG: hypothetical protein AAGJ37_11445 [Pseudomonadota bacterium]